MIRYIKPLRLAIWVPFFSCIGLTFLCAIIGLMRAVYLGLASIDPAGIATKTLWDWMQLCIVPLVISAGTVILARRLSLAEIHREQDRSASTTLQAYLASIAGMISNESLLTSEKRSAVRTVARSLTLSTLHQLDPKRKATLLYFLYDLGLLFVGDPIINMSDSDLEAIALSGFSLPRISLRDSHMARLSIEPYEDREFPWSTWRTALRQAGEQYRADLSHADLQGSGLAGAKLARAYMKGTNLTDANLRDADLRGANLRNALLVRASLEGTDLKGADLRGADLREATLSIDPEYANWLARQFGRTLIWVVPGNVSFLSARLTGAKIDRATNFEGAKLSRRQLNLIARSLR